MTIYVDTGARDMKRGPFKYRPKYKGGYSYTF